MPRRGSSPPTPPDWSSQRSRSTSPGPPPASPAAPSARPAPRQCAVPSSPSPPGSRTRPDAGDCTYHPAGPGKTSSTRSTRRHSGHRPRSPPPDRPPVTGTTTRNPKWKRRADRQPFHAHSRNHREREPGNPKSSPTNARRRIEVQSCSTSLRDRGRQATQFRGSTRRTAGLGGTSWCSLTKLLTQTPMRPLLGIARSPKSPASGFAGQALTHDPRLEFSATRSMLGSVHSASTRQT